MPKTDPAPRGVHTDPDGVTWWAAPAVASALCCSPDTVRRMSRRAGFPTPYRFGSLIRWRADDVRTWREEQRRGEALATPADWQPARPVGRRTGPKRAA